MKEEYFFQTYNYVIKFNNLHFFNNSNLSKEFLLSFMQQDPQFEDLQTGKHCDELPQGKIVTLLWYLECAIDPVRELFIYLFSFLRRSVNIAQVDLPQRAV